MERPTTKDAKIIAYIEYLENKLKKFESSPYMSSYMSLYKKITEWDEQLLSNRIDLFADKDSKEFDRAHKYFTEQKPYFEQLSYLRKLMTPEEQKELEKQVSMNNLRIAEKIALMNGDD